MSRSRYDLDFNQPIWHQRFDNDRRRWHTPDAEDLSASLLVCLCKGGIPEIARDAHDVICRHFGFSEDATDVGPQQRKLRLKIGRSLPLASSPIVPLTNRKRAAPVTSIA
jgi:hypothetical protein